MLDLNNVLKLKFQNYLNDRPSLEILRINNIKQSQKYKSILVEKISLVNILMKCIQQVNIYAEKYCII